MGQDSLRGRCEPAEEKEKKRSYRCLQQPNEGCKEGGARPSEVEQGSRWNMGNASLTQRECFSSRGRSSIGRRAQAGAGSTSSGTVNASPNGLAHIRVTEAAHHQQSFHSSSFWVPSLLPTSWTSTANRVAQTCCWSKGKKSHSHQEHKGQALVCRSSPGNKKQLIFLLC